MSSSKTIVTIVGSITPSVILPRGEERTVLLTPRVQRLIDRGYVTVTKREEIAAPRTEPPPRFGTKQAWIDFLTDQGYEIPPNATRAELLDMWDASV